MTHDDFIAKAEKVIEAFDKRVAKGNVGESATIYEVDWQPCENILIDMFGDTEFKECIDLNDIEPDFNKKTVVFMIDPRNIGRYKDCQAAMAEINFVGNTLSFFFNPFNNGDTYNVFTREISSETIKDLCDIYKAYLDGANTNKLTLMCAGKYDIQVLKE